MSKSRINQIMRLCSNREENKKVGIATVKEPETSTKFNNIDNVVHIDLQEDQIKNDSYKMDNNFMIASLADQGSRSEIFKYLENYNETSYETSYANLENADPFLLGQCENVSYESISKPNISQTGQELVNNVPVNISNTKELVNNVPVNILNTQELVNNVPVNILNTQQSNEEFDLHLETFEVEDFQNQISSVTEVFIQTPFFVDVVSESADDLISDVDNERFLQSPRPSLNCVGLPQHEENELAKNNCDHSSGSIEGNGDQDPADGSAEQSNTILVKGRPKKGRKRKIPDQSREDRQKRCKTNQDYISAKGKLVESREFRDYHCACKCYQKVTKEDRLKEFNRFWTLDTLSAKCLFICSKVSVKPVARKRFIGPTVRSNTRVYSLAGQPVCKSIFLQTLRVSSCRVNKYLQMHSNLEPIKDNRGQRGGSNKLSQTKEDEVVEHISKYPKYKSHYCREQNQDKEYLTSETTLPLMYSMYKEEYFNPVSLSKYKQIFYSKFNLTRKTLKKDTCNKCDAFSAQAKSTTSEALKLQIKQEHAVHLLVAENAQSLMKADLLRASNDNELEVLTFNMQKTLPLPRIPTNIVFYKRQLWLYNLGIHSGKNNKGYFYVWLEGEAGRGAQEVGSCVMKHLKYQLKESVKELIVWSDSCGGQNRNIKMVLLFKTFFKAHPHLEKIKMRYLVPGHTYLPNDSEFGDIECALKLHNRLYTPYDNINVIENARKKNKFSVTCMSKEDFFSSNKLEKAITNRKKFTDGSKVSWLRTREIVLTRESKFTLGLSTAFNAVPKTLDIQKTVRQQPRRSVTASASNLDMQPFNQSLDLLWPNGKPISDAKLADITSLLHLIPGDAKQFYTNLTTDCNALDDIDGFDSPLDFEVEMDEETD